MPLTPELRKHVQQSLVIRDSVVPLHRVLDILASEDGDISKIISRFRDIKEPSLRRAFHQCAVLLRELEQEAGLTPAWEAKGSATSSAGGGGASARSASSGASGGAAASSSVAPAKATSLKSPKFRPEELLPFEDDAWRGQARMAKAYVDGASKGNPGPAGVGAVLYNMAGQKMGQVSRSIGVATNNQAEYTALRDALEMALRLGVKTLFVFGDSELMVKQYNGQYKIKNPDIQVRMDEIRQLVSGLEKFTITWIPREKNAMADALSTNCLPKKSTGAAAGSGTRARESDDFMGAIDETADEGATE